MAKHFTAVYEKGVLRPEHPIDLPEGEQLHLIVVARKSATPNGNVADALAEIAVLPPKTTPALSQALNTIVSYIPGPNGFC